MGIFDSWFNAAPAEKDVTEFDNIDDLRAFLDEHPDESITGGSIRQTAATNKDLSETLATYENALGVDTKTTDAARNKLLDMLTNEQFKHIMDLTHSDQSRVENARGLREWETYDDIDELFEALGNCKVVISEQGRDKDAAGKHYNVGAVVKSVDEYAHDRGRVAIGGKAYLAYAEKAYEKIIPTDLAEHVKRLVDKKLADDPNWMPGRDDRWQAVLAKFEGKQ